MALEVFWYCVLGVSALFYVLLDGFDLGVGALHLLAKNDRQRRMFLNAIGPVWDGNEVWVVVVVGGLFAGFPNAYATALSGFYTPMMFLLMGLMFRASAIEFRSKRPSALWRSTWDVVFSFASILVAFVLGLLLGNLILGIPLDANQDFTGTFTLFLRPYALLLGVTSVALFAMHGAIYLAMKTEGETYRTVRQWIIPSILVFIGFYIATTIATFLTVPYMTQFFETKPLLVIFPILAFVSIVNVPLQVHRGCEGWAFISSCASLTFLLSLFSFGTFPTIILSTVNPETNSLTLFNAASSQETLMILGIIALIGAPLVLSYGFWVYWTFRGKVKDLDSSSY